MYVTNPKQHSNHQAAVHTRPKKAVAVKPRKSEHGYILLLMNSTVHCKKENMLFCLSKVTQTHLNCLNNSKVDGNGSNKRIKTCISVK